MNGVRLLKYGTTNTYLIEGRDGYLLLDTGWAGTLPEFYRALGDMKVAAQEIRYVLITHYHPDHMGIAQDITETGAQLVIMDVQKEFVHSSDAIFAKEPKTAFQAVDESRARVISCAESRAFLRDLGIEGEILHSPGHSDDSISLWLDAGALFVGDLNPLYEREMHRGTQIDATWERLLALKPKVVYYGHAKPAELEAEDAAEDAGRSSHEPVTEKPGIEATQNARLYDLVGRIMKYIDRGMNLQKIAKKTGADATFVEDVARMYLTHTNVGVQGILDRIEIKGK